MIHATIVRTRTARPMGLRSMSGSVTCLRETVVCSRPRSESRTHEKAAKKNVPTRRRSLGAWRDERAAQHLIVFGVDRGDQISTRREVEAGARRERRHVRVRDGRAVGHTAAFDRDLLAPFDRRRWHQDRPSEPRSTVGPLGRGGQGPASRDHQDRRLGRSQAPASSRGRGLLGRSAAHHGGRQPGPAQERGGLRCPLWSRSRRCIIWEDHPQAPEPRRGSLRERRSVDDRPRPDGARPTDPRLRGPQGPTRQHVKGDPSDPQAQHRTGALPDRP